MDTTNKLAEEALRERIIAAGGNRTYRYPESEDELWVLSLHELSKFAAQAAHAVSEPVATQPAEAVARLACPRCGWTRGHDYGCPNDPLNPGIVRRVAEAKRMAREYALMRASDEECFAAIDAITHPAPASASEPDPELPGMWEASDLSGGEADSSASVAGAGEALSDKQMDEALGLIAGRTPEVEVLRFRTIGRRVERALIDNRAATPDRSLTELLKDALASVQDYQSGLEFGRHDRKLIGRLKAALAARPVAQGDGEADHD